MGFWSKVFGIGKDDDKKADDADKGARKKSDG